ncbi:hypothetical protein GGI04_005483 [Coemansia thaxteri]|uniref:Uncharacterized protein n=1 Tax=Coemansia thaxteri TaxID=2663907 RepID=A0A9W8BJP0_9FUNG|nr:hypothetical protein GGI04_005483 [Coemansia thaxteri]KAJ2003562.1 hypothetical protein H4R26_003002 [Coemansia thaxteri]KAJ2481584.1 hypothetical protein EV174_003438 [Coemansia sp. RSA 2320]
MYSTFTPVAALAVGLLVVVTAARAADLVDDAGTITDTKSYASAVSQSWASVYYRVNQNLNDAMFLGKSADYAKATWLYGTTQLPASYVATWAPAYLGRAQELFSQTATAQSPHQSSSSEHDASSLDDVDSASTHKTSAAALMLGPSDAALVIAAAIVVVSFI